MDHDKAFQDISLEGQETIWAAIIYYQAFDLADWMFSKGYDATETYRWDDGDDTGSVVPYDALKWDEWIQSKLTIYPENLPDSRDAGMLPYKICRTKVCRKETIKELVRRKYISIPLNSGLPLYYWLLEGYTQDDFCGVYSCIEYLGDYFDDDYRKDWSVEQVETCLENYMEESIRAGTAYNMVKVGFENNSGNIQEYHDKVVVRLVENMYLKYRGKRRSWGATKIQNAFRAHGSKKRVDILRSQPGNLFHGDFGATRKRILEIDDARFGSVA